MHRADVGDREGVAADRESLRRVEDRAIRTAGYPSKREHMTIGRYAAHEAVVVATVRLAHDVAHQIDVGNGVVDDVLGLVQSHARYGDDVARRRRRLKAMTRCECECREWHEQHRRLGGNCRYSHGVAEVIGIASPTMSVA